MSNEEVYQSATVSARINRRRGDEQRRGLSVGYRECPD
jgi:hypothetical protein